MGLGFAALAFGAAPALALAPALGLRCGLGGRLGDALFGADRAERRRQLALHGVAENSGQERQ